MQEVAGSIPAGSTMHEPETQRDKREWNVKL